MPEPSTWQSSKVEKAAKISPHFTLGELCKSQTAERMGIDNSPNKSQLECLTLVAQRVLEPVREHFGKPFAPNSGFRCLELNSAIGSSSKSQHCKGQAIVVDIPGTSNEEVARWIKETISYDQLILEYWTPGEPNSGWVHVSYKKEINSNRKEYLMAIKTDGKTSYKPILNLSTDRYVK